MLTSKPQKKQRGRQKPVYGPYRCPWCQAKLRLAKDLWCKCGWKE